LFLVLLVRLIWRVAAGGERQLLAWYRYRVIAAGAIMGIYLIMSVAAISIMFYRLHNADLYRLLDRVASVVGREDRVYGEMIFWMGRDRYRYGPFPVEFRDGAYQYDIEAIAKHRFDYVVRTVWQFASSYGIASPPADMPPFRPSYTLDHICSEFGTKIDEFRDPHYGPIEIYKLNWDKPSPKMQIK
jgi:hypothetical protein